MSVVDLISPGDLAFTGTVGAVLLFVLAIRYGDWLPTLHSGDLPYRWGRVVHQLDQMKADLIGWVFATLGLVVTSMVLLFIFGSMWT